MQLNRNLTDIVKFLACILVALGHFCGHAISTGDTNLLYQAISTQGGFLGVALFFFLSGYGLMMSERKAHLTLLSFLKRRYLKIYLPCVLSAILWIPISYLTIRGGYSVDYHIVTSTLWGWGDGILWFVKTLMMLYATFYIYTLIRNRTDNEILRLLILTLFAVITTAIQWQVADYSAISVPFFYVGVASVDCPSLTKQMSRWWVTGITLVLTMAFCGLLVKVRHDMLFAHAAFNYAVVMMWIWVAVSKPFKLFKPCYSCDSCMGLPKWVGGMSYDIYLTHNKVLMLLIYYLHTFPLWLFLLCTALVTIAFYNIRKLLKI